MGYTKTAWVDGETPINAKKLNKMEDFLEAVDKRTEDSGWKTATLSSKFSSASSQMAPRYRKIGNMVEIIGCVNPKSTITGNSDVHEIFTLPAGFRPVMTIYDVSQGSSVNTWLCSISAGGVVYFSRYRNSSGYIDAKTDAWLMFHVVFFTQ